ncbi:hypothetical protein LMG28727_06847 [Paraburkholderia kirstenboschensis]|nr:hypothetical protein LMG28727_06847 [Paraburkholderia kirstenboschensis]
MVPLCWYTVPVWLPPISAARFRFSAFDVDVILPFSVMLPFAASVRFAAAPPVFVMSAPACCTILPVAVPELAVVIVTSVPAFSAPLIAPLFTVALLVDGVNVPFALVSLAVAPVLIVTFVGSISHWPALPSGAAALTAPSTFRL